jgi:hypothetical protein
MTPKQRQVTVRQVGYPRAPLIRVASIADALIVRV